MKRKVNPYERSRLLAVQQMVMKLSQTYEKALYLNRYKELRSTILKLEEVPFADWETKAPLLLEAPYLNKLIPNLYRAVGIPVARDEINHFLGQKAAPDMWEQSVNRWVQEKAGEKINIIKENYQDWFRGFLKDSLDPKLSVEEMVGSLYSKVTNDFANLQEWQVRRIIQTESLTSMSVASSESIKELKIPFVKTWIISGNNTRPAHAVMDGFVVDDTELFNVDGDFMEFPRDGENGASAGNIINCACSVTRDPK